MQDVGVMERAAAPRQLSSPRGVVRLAGSVAGIVTAAAMLLTVPWLPVRAMATASASAEPCPAVQVVFARGTGEQAGLGRVGAAFVDSLRGQVRGKSLAAYAVEYPATRDFLGALDGANDAAAFVSDTVAACPDPRLSSADIRKEQRSSTSSRRLLRPSSDSLGRCHPTSQHTLRLRPSSAIHPIGLAEAH